MFKGNVRLLTLFIVATLCLPTTSFTSAQALETPTKVKELNFVFLHGAGRNGSVFQLLADSIEEQIPTYIQDYELSHPGIKIQWDTLQRSYPNDVDINTWANNIADGINKHFRNKKNLILIGHSMGGKSALYAVAHNTGNLTAKTAMVVTMNSPIKSLGKYYFAGGSSVLDYWGAQRLMSDRGVISSIVNYDSSQDGYRVGQNKHWLAFISAEPAPLSEQFDVGGIDVLPRNMDDTIVPIDAQYSDGADVIYYGEHAHSEFSETEEVARSIAEQILRYIFGEYIECSILAKSGTFEHGAGWLPKIDNWEDVTGEIPVSSGTLQHRNESYIRWQEWEDVIGEYSPNDKRSSYQVNRLSFPLLTGIQECRWLNPDNPQDCRLYIRTRAAPRSRIQVEWSIQRQGLLPEGVKRDHYEVGIATGTPLTNIGSVSWVTDDPRDLRLQISSEAEGPFRWFSAEWRVYIKDVRRKMLIEEISAEVLKQTS